MSFKVKASVVILLFNTGFLVAQDQPHPQKSYFYLEAGISRTHLVNENLSSDKTLFTEATMQPNIGLGYSFRMGSNMFFYLGGHFRSFATMITCKGSFQNPELKVDKDNYLYYLLSEANYTDKRGVTTLTFPLGFKLSSVNTSFCRVVAQAAIEPSFILQSSDDRKGSIETKGMYPDAQYSNVFHIINNVPNYGYNTRGVSDEAISNSGLVLGFSLGIGAAAPINNRIDLLFNVGYFTTAGDIINKEDRDQDYTNLEGRKMDYKKTSLSSVSINLGLAIK